MDWMRGWVPILENCFGEYILIIAFVLVLCSMLYLYTYLLHLVKPYLSWTKIHVLPFGLFSFGGIYDTYLKDLFKRLFYVQADDHGFENYYRLNVFLYRRKGLRTRHGG